MTHTITRINIDELNTVRVTCLKCNATVEIELEKIGRSVDGQACACCKEVVLDDDQTSRLKDLARAIQSVQRLDRIGVEFSLASVEK